MSVLYIALAPIFIYLTIRRIKGIRAAIMNHRTGELQGHLLFLGRSILVTCLIILVIKKMNISS